MIRQLRDARKQVQLLKAAWRRFVPHIDLAQAVHTVETQTTPDSSTLVQEGFDHATTITAETPGPPEDGAGESSQNIIAPYSNADQEDEKWDTLEWNEIRSLRISSDGIGSLTVDPKGSGYMGPQSGNSLLRYLQSIANFFPEADDAHDGDRDELGAPGLLTAREPPSSHMFTQSCIDWYFKHFHSAYPILHEGYFRAQNMGVIAKSQDGSWPLLFNIVLALGAFAGPQSSNNYDIYFFNRAREHISADILQCGSLQLVQAFTLLANYTQKRNMPNSGFTMLGIAYNLALGLGLHREFSEKASSAFTMEVRRRVWWTLYIFDTGARLTFGRPTMELHGTNIKPPKNLHDSDISVDIESLPASRDEPTAASSLIWQSKLAAISSTVNTILLEKQLPDQIRILALDDEVSKWKQSLPLYFFAALEAEFAWFEIPRAVLLWRSWHLRIVMTRPFLLDVVRNRRALILTDANSAVSRCINSAQECIVSINTFCHGRSEMPGALVWYATYWLVTAVFVNVTCLIYDPYNGLSPVWRQQAESSKLILETMGAVEPIAKRAASILKNIIGKIVKFSQSFTANIISKGLVPSSPDSTILGYNEPTRMEIADVWGQSWAMPPMFDQELQDIIQMPRDMLNS
jgi:transcriptional regulatory protein GAL4